MKLTTKSFISLKWSKILPIKFPIHPNPTWQTFFPLIDKSLVDHSSRIPSSATELLAQFDNSSWIFNSLTFVIRCIEKVIYSMYEFDSVLLWQWVWWIPPGMCVSVGMASCGGRSWWEVLWYVSHLDPGATERCLNYRPNCRLLYQSYENIDEASHLIRHDHDLAIAQGPQWLWVIVALFVLKANNFDDIVNLSIFHDLLTKGQC